MDVRIAMNQIHCRWANERARARLDGVREARYRCECGQADCAETVELRAGEYEAIRLHPARFAVAPGHEFTGVNVVIVSSGRFVVVEALGQAAEMARELDPRQMH